jgi:hypothetical protein
MVIRVSCDLSYWFSVREIASQVVANCRNVIDGHYQLWCFLIGFEEFEGNGLVEQVIAIWNCSV